MELSSKFFGELSTAELYEILKARSEIFVVEQQCVYQDVDDVDYRSLHIFYTAGGKVAAYLRAFIKDEDSKTIQLGRVLTVQHGHGLGGMILKEGIKEAAEKLNAGRLYIEAQSYATGFYQRQGFAVCSDEFMEDGIPHVQMELTI
ncbi:GNAT family N-acetyltransferase [Bifidobacterium sp.]